MALTPGRIHGGGARLFVGITAPTTGTPPTLMGHTDGVPASGTDVGATEGDTTFRYKAEKKSIPAEQSLADVDVMTISEMAEFEFTAKEQTYVTLQRAFDNIGTVSDSSKELFYAGNGTNILAPRTEAVMLTSRQRNAPTKFIVTVIYKAFSVNGYEMPFKKNGESVFKVLLRGLADTSRDAGDQLFQHFFEK